MSSRVRAGGRGSDCCHCLSVLWLAISFTLGAGGLLFFALSSTGFGLLARRHKTHTRNGRRGKSGGRGELLQRSHNSCCCCCCSWLIILVLFRTAQRSFVASYFYQQPFCCCCCRCMRPKPAEMAVLSPPLPLPSVDSLQTLLSAFIFCCRAVYL